MGELKSADRQQRPRFRQWTRRLLGRIAILGGRTSRRALLRGAAFGLVAGAFFYLLWLSGLVYPLELATLDARFVLRSLLTDPSEPSPVTVVAIDDQAVAAFGRWPWPRTIQAEVISAILAERPAALGINIVYSTPSEDFRSDERLARSIRSDIPVVLAASTRSEREQLPLLSLLAPNVYTAHGDILADADGVVRQVPLELPSSVGPLRALSWEMARRLGVEAPPEGAGERLVRINYRTARTEGATAAARLARTVSAVDVVNGRAGELLRGRPVLLGVTSGGVDAIGGDLTPLRHLGPVPSVYVHAAALATLLQGDFVREPSAGLLALGLIGGGALIGGIAFLLRPWPGTLLFSLLFGGTLGYALWRFIAASEWIVVVPNAALLAAVYVAGLWHAHLEVEREAGHIRETFRRYVAPQVVDALLEQPGVAQMGGGRRVVTVLFADIRGFTSFAERHPPEFVVRHLNRYLALMCESVLKYGGMVDKYLGDGLLALFGAPLPMADHPEAAVRAALDLLGRVEEALRQDEGVELTVGVGIHSGEAVVGSIGSPARLEYTAIGDTVNVASRLQDFARSGTAVVSEATYALLPPELAARGRRIPPVALSGRSEAVVAYEFDINEG